MKHAICDKCGAVGAHEVIVNIRAVGVVVDGNPTSVEHGIEVCAACRPAAARELLESALAQFERDVPIHRELVRLSELDTTFTKKAVESVALRDKYTNTAPEFHKHNQDVEKFMAQAEEAKQQKIVLQESAK